MDLFVPAVLSRGTGARMAALLRNWEARGRGVDGLEQVALRHAGRASLLFLVSDFHWPLERLAPVLDLWSHAYVVPMVVWDSTELRPPEHTGLLSVWDMESQSRRTLWMRPKLRERWLEAVVQRRAELTALLRQRNIRPFFMEGEFDAEAMSRYFFEAAA
jgi:hypothetical protein